MRVSGRSDCTGRARATADPSACRRTGLGFCCKGTDLEPIAARLAGRLPGATVMTVQNGLGAEEIVAAHGEWPILSSVTFMSGTRHADATSSTSSTRPRGSARAAARPATTRSASPS